MKINGHFHVLNTIIFDDKTEMIVDDYFEHLEKGVKDGSIRDFSYDMEQETFSYNQNGNQYVIKVHKCMPNKIKFLFNLMIAEKNKRLVENDKKANDNRKKKLLDQARNGEIVSDEAKSLYMEELINERKNLIKGIFKLDLEHSKFYDWLMYNADELVFFEFAIAIPVGVIVGLIAYFYGFEAALPLGGMSTVGVLILTLLTALETMMFEIVPIRARLLTLLVDIVHNFGHNLVRFLKEYKRIKPMLKVIKYKIKELKKYNVPTDEYVSSNLDTNTQDNYIDGYYTSIATALTQLDGEKKEKLRSEFLDKYNDYKAKKEKLKKSSNVLEAKPDAYQDREFLMYLAEFEQRVLAMVNGSSVEASHERGAQMIAAVDHSMDPASKGKIRKLERDKMTMSS